MYHEITSSAAGAGGYFSVRRSDFAAQLERLAELGLRGESMESLVVRPAPDRVAITFDDGHVSHFAEAYPELATRGMTATFFVITSRVGQPGYVTWSELREMAGAGMSIQSHTHTHPFLSELSRARVVDELRTSKRWLDDELGQRTTSLAFPGGDAPRGWRAADFAALGYRWVATSRWGPNLPDGRHHVRRYTVRRDGTPESFETIACARSTAWSPEAIRLLTLNRVRAAMGPTRYARLRRVALRALGR